MVDGEGGDWTDACAAGGRLTISLGERDSARISRLDDERAIFYLLHACVRVWWL